MGQLLDIFGANKTRKAQENAADKSIAASKEATDKTLAINKDMFDRVWTGTQVQRDAGDAATRMMAKLMGLKMPEQQPVTNGSATVPWGGTPTDNAFNYSGGGRAPQGALESRVAAMGDGSVYDGAGGGENFFGTGQVGRADMIPANQPQPQASGVGATPTGDGLGQDQSVTDWLRSTPGYQFNFDEGQRAMNASLAARGGLLSGDAGREAIKYGQGNADRTYNDQFNRLAAIAGTGQTATSQGASAGANYAGNAGNAFQWNARNLASSYGAKADATSSFWGDMSGMFGQDAIARYAGQAMKGGF